MKEYVIISECLAGINCRYDGKNNRNDKVLEFIKNNNCILICPEQLGGLSTPRVPAEIIRDKVINKNGVDVTDNFVKGAEESLKIALIYNCKRAILKAKSPSCGSKVIYDGSHNARLRKGMGITTKLFIENGIEVLNEENSLLVDE